MSIINKGILDSRTAYLRQVGNDWPTAQVIFTSDIIESTNLYYTNARVNVFVQPWLTTANVRESSTALYYTNARVNSFIQGNLVLKANVVDLTTSNVAEGSNLYYTNTRVVSAVTPLLTAANIANFTSTVNATVQPFLTTANVVETSGNLYFTNTRVIFAAIPAVTELTVTTPVFNYNIDQYAGDNPAIYVSAGETIAFNLNVSGSHPFNIRVSDGGSNYNTGLTHIAQDGTVSTESSAQGKVTGKLFWKIPYVLAGNTYVYQCTNHSSMVGSIFIQRPVSTITTDNVTEGSNLYYTNARVLQAITVGTIPGNLAVSGNLIANGLIIRNISVSDSVLSGNITAGGFSGNTIAVDVITSNVWNGLYTANVIETNGNLYYTNTRVYSNVIALLPTLAGQNITIEANGRISASTTGTVSLDGLTTSNLAEGINLYYTNARARTAYTAGQNITIDSGTGVITSTAGTTVVNDSDLITVLAATTNYTLSRTVSDPKNILVINEGLIQIPTTDYTVSGTTLTTTTQYPVGSNIEIRYFGIDSTTAGAYSTTLSAVLNTFVANGSNINFPLTATPVSAAYTIVNIDGVSQLTSAYSISGSTLTFTEAPEANANINVRILGGAVGQTFNTRTYTGDGNTTNFPITSGFTENNILVFENGVAQIPTADYTVNTTTSNVIMAVATAANVSIQIRELGSTTANVLSQILNSDLTTSNVVPKAGNTYNLGSTSAPYNKLYLSASNSLVLGNTTVSVSGNSLILSTGGVSTEVGTSTSSLSSRIYALSTIFGG